MDKPLHAYPTDLLETAALTLHALPARRVRQGTLPALSLFSGAGGSAAGYMAAGFHVTGVDICAQPRYCGDAFVHVVWTMGDKKFKLLDLFSGAGGSAAGYMAAGFHVTGVDICAQPRYCGDAFIQADALTVSLAGYDAIHASPPCQAYSPLNARWAYRHTADLIPQVRTRLQMSGAPWIIENVPGSPLGYWFMLCGGMFGLRTYRHRRFETSWFVFQPEHPPHVVRTSTRKRRADWDRGLHVSVTGNVGAYVGRAAMGISWMTSAELSQAIPPAYTAWLGAQLMRYVGGREEAGGG